MLINANTYNISITMFPELLMIAMSYSSVSLKLKGHILLNYRSCNRNKLCITIS